MLDRVLLSWLGRLYVVITIEIMSHLAIQFVHEFETGRQVYSKRFVQRIRARTSVFLRDANNVVLIVFGDYTLLRKHLSYPQIMAPWNLTNIVETVV